MIATFLFLTLWVSTYSMEIHLDIDVGEFKVEQEADGTLRIQADGWVHGFIPNALDIPSKPIFVVLPQHTKLVDVEIVDADSLLLAVGEIAKTPNFDAKAHVPMETELTKHVEGIGTYSLSGYQIASFRFCPISYDTVTHNVFLLRHATLRLKLGTNEKTYETPLYISEADQSLLRKALAALVANPHDLDLFAPPTIVVNPLRDSLRNVYPYVIVTTEDLADAFDEFKVLKALEGRPLIVRTLEWINSHYTGADVQERIRNFLKDMYLHHGTRWAMLAGDSPFIPARVVNVPIGTGYYDDIPTDFYYACLDGNWDYDNDGRYGELEDSVDIMPDIFVSRMPFRSRDEVQQFLTKYLTYISGPTSDTGYFTRALFVGAELFSPGDGAQLCEEISQEFPPHFHTIAMYEVEDNDNNAQDFIDTLNSGVGMVIAEVHGWYTFINVNSSPTQSFDYNDADSLRNIDMPTFFNIVSCEIGGFDRDCIVEHLLRARGGAIAVLSSTRNNYPYVVQPYNLSFYNLLFSQHIRQIGLLDLMSRSVFVPYANAYNHSRYSLFSYSLLGDPGLRLWDNTPMGTSLRATDWITTGWSLINVNVSSGGSPATSVKVVAYKPNETYVEGFTDANGDVQLWVNPKTAGILFVAVVDSAHFLAVDTVVVFESGIAPFVAELNISDADCDGKPEPDEDLELTLHITNNGFLTVENIWVKIVGTDSALTAYNDSIYIDSLRGGDTLTLSAPLRLHVHNRVVNGYRAFVAFGFYNFADTMSLDTVYIEIAAPILRQWFTRIQNSGTGSFKVTPSMRNLGDGDAKGVRLRLLPTSGIQILRDSAFIPIVEAHDVGYAEDGFVVHPMSPGFLPLKIPMVVEHQASGLSDTLQIGISEVGVPESLNLMSGINSIRLSWKRPSENGESVIGYLVYRSSDNLNYSLLTPDPITHTNFEDFNITPGIPYTYRITAVDSLMNESEPLESSEAYSYELLSGWPKIVMGPAVPLIADIDPNFDGKEIIVPSEDNHVYAFHWDGSEVDGWPVNIGFVLKGLAAADLDGDGFDEVVAVPYRGADSVFVFDGDASILDGWPRYVPRGSWAAPTIYDLDNDGSPEIIVHAVAGKLYIWHADGTAFSSFDTSGLFVELPEGSGGFAEVAVGDIDADGEPEIAVGDRSQGVTVFNLDRTVVPGFPTGYGTMTTISVADFLPDEPGLEIVTFYSTDRIYLFKSNGEVADGWPVYAPGAGYNFSMHAIPGDIDNDGEIEVICNLSDGVGAFNTDGTWAEGFPYYFREGVYTTGAPLIVDVDGDSVMEAFQPGYYKFFGVTRNGLPFGSFPLDIVAGSYRSAAIDDIDSDGHAELVIPATDGFVYVFRLPGQFTPNGWMQYQHDAARTGNYELGHQRRLHGVSDGRLSTISKVSIKVWPSIVRDALHIEFSLGKPMQLQFNVYDVSGRLVFQKGYRVTPNSRDVIVWKPEKLGSGVYFYQLKNNGRNIFKGKFVVLK